jgi:Zn-finger nucleic acid-binding protein
MKCPACDVTLVMADRQGIEIDYCPQCRGVWLDRGELDKVIERTANLAPQVVTPPPPPPPSAPQYQQHQQHQQPYRQEHQHRPHYGDDYYKHKKKKNLLGELFDF